MKGINLYIPTKIYFGKDILSEAIEKEKVIISGNVMIVTGKNAIKRLGYLDRLINHICNLDTINNIELYEGISSNPKTTEINLASQYGIERKINTVIGLGGGSVIDAAKAIAVGIGTRENIETFMFNGKEPPKETLPIIAIPTTAGTGSELSKGAILTSTDKVVKTGIRGDYIRPRLAIVDPVLTLQLPEKETKETGFDVLAHAIESFISKQSNRFTEMLSIEAIKITAKYLPKLVKDGSDINARENMCYASMLMGINLGNSSTCLPHRMQYPVGAITDTGHSQGLASIYRAWFYYGYDYSKEKFNKIGFLLLGKRCKKRDDVLNSFDGFMEKINLKVRLSELGINNTNIDIICRAVTGNISNDPVIEHDNVIRKIYEASL